MTEGRHAIPPSRFPAVLVGVLLVLAIVAAAGGAGIGLMALAAAGPEQPTVAGLIWTIVPLLAGVVLAVGLWAAAWLVHQAWHGAVRQARLLDAVEALGARLETHPRHSPVREHGVEVPSPPEQGVQTARAVAPSDDALAAVLDELRELNVNILLNEPERQAKRKDIAERRCEELTAQVRQAVAAGDLAAARGGLDALRRVAPQSGRIGPLAKGIDRAAEDAEARRVADATGRAEDLMSVGDFDQARRAAEELLARHPDSPAAIALLHRVQREAEAYATEHRRQTVERIQKAAAGRHWRQAREAAEELIRTYPESPEADSARARLETIRTNARIEYARELRDRIRDLIARRRFGDALEIARHVLREFPETTMAEELKGQMARLEELAAKGDGGEGGQ